MFIYTDGSYKSQEDRIGLGAVLVQKVENLVYICLECARTLEPRTDLNAFDAEILGAAMGLEYVVNVFTPIEVYLDNLPLCNILSTTQKQNPKYSNSWAVLDKQVSKVKRASWFWVKSHGTNFFNERADALAAVSPFGTSQCVYTAYTSDGNFTPLGKLDYNLGFSDREVFEEFVNKSIEEATVQRIMNKTYHLIDVGA